MKIQKVEVIFWKSSSPSLLLLDEAEWQKVYDGKLECDGKVYRFSFRRAILCSAVSASLQPLGCSLPGSSVRGIFQARILKWAAISFFKGSSQTRDWTHVSCVSCIAGRFFTTEPWGSLLHISLAFLSIF